MESWGCGVSLRVFVRLSAVREFFFAGDISRLESIALSRLVVLNKRGVSSSISFKVELIPEADPVDK
jgi:hypothetical protein